MYQALYRKWRPRAFADVVGQEHITETLRRQVAQSRLSHAYLFTGTRGTGKTTCAKILSKAVNCEHPVNGDPCNRCPACLGIDNGSLLDVMELDAASNNGVDHVRALRDEAIYSPATVKYRVYIIDEVHMLSTAAFNALLKILEEPPVHLIFILATTELHKVPATILSRCQRFAFKRIQPADIARRLEYVAGEEGMELRPEAAELLSRLSDGALRDALSLLDQCSAAGGVIDPGRVLDVLGLAGTLQTAKLMEHVLQRDVPQALLLLDRLYTGGKDVAALLGELSTLTRDMLIRATAPQGGASLLSGGCDIAMLDDLSRGVAPSRLIYMAATLQSTLAALPMSANRRTDGELCLMRLCDETLCGDTTALAARLARLEEGGRPHRRESTPASCSASAPMPEPIPVPAAAAEPLPWEERPPLPDAPPWDAVDSAPQPAPWDEPPPYGEPAAPAAPEVPAAPAPEPVPLPVRQRAPQPPVSGGEDVWRKLVERYKERLTPMYWFMLDDAVGVMEGDVLVVVCGDDLTRDTLDNEQVTQVLRSVTGEHLGVDIRVRYTLKGQEQTVQPPAEDKLDALIRTGSKFDSFKLR